VGNPNRRPTIKNGRIPLPQNVLENSTRIKMPSVGTNILEEMTYLECQRNSCEIFLIAEFIAQKKVPKF
jgi:hypothetical protein